MQGLEGPWVLSGMNAAAFQEEQISCVVASEQEAPRSRLVSPSSPSCRPGRGVMLCLIALCGKGDNYSALSVS